ncbi:helix-turn-helix domain-containing protein [Aerococcaceae bacterium zg-ZJ1578]|uniref:helix-turn-helix domain-containing protein n=1 Tax=Aerococcaceae bacterium zg-252 TaxID=2796928 RepID=UPI001A356793|nr:helix-turn-helix domain-containing protein [Aerococcaceae bacterium zg-1578]
MFDELEKKLYELTPSEHRYLQKDYVDYDQRNITTTINEHKVYQFYLKDMVQLNLNHTHYFIRKQSRFAAVPNHITDVIELNYVYSGESIQYINGQKFHLVEGDLVIIDTHVSHEVCSSGYNDIVLSINIDQQFFIEHFFRHLNQNTALTRFIYQAISESQNHNQYLFFKGGNSSKLKLLFQQLMSEVYFPQLLESDYKDHLIQLIFLELIRSYSPEINGTNENSDKQQLTLDILSYINSNYATTSLQDCANYFGYNSSYFSTLIKAITGSTFKDILQEKKIEAAIPILLHTNETIKEIANEVGFSNINQFYSLFKKQFGLTPAQYRENK